MKPLNIWRTTFGEIVVPALFAGVKGLLNHDQYTLEMLCELKNLSHESSRPAIRDHICDLECRIKYYSDIFDAWAEPMHRLECVTTLQRLSGKKNEKLDELHKTTLAKYQFVKDLPPKIPGPGDRVVYFSDLLRAGGRDAAWAVLNALPDSVRTVTIESGSTVDDYTLVRDAEGAWGHPMCTSDTVGTKQCYVVKEPARLLKNIRVLEYMVCAVLDGGFVVGRDCNDSEPVVLHIDDLGREV